MDTLDYFALFNLPPVFDLDMAQLKSRYLERAREVHPDRFVQAGAREQRQALEHSANLNEAYETLKDPTQRARYLLQRMGRAVSLETTVQDPEFLLQQMGWREELEALHGHCNPELLEAFNHRLQKARQQLACEFMACWQDTTQQDLAEQLVRRMQFLDKLAQEVRQLEEHLDD